MSDKADKKKARKKAREHFFKLYPDTENSKHNRWVWNKAFSTGWNAGKKHEGECPNSTTGRHCGCKRKDPGAQCCYCRQGPAIEYEED